MFGACGWESIHMGLKNFPGMWMEVRFSLDESRFRRRASAIVMMIIVFADVRDTGTEAVFDPTIVIEKVYRITFSSLTIIETFSRFGEEDERAAHGEVDGIGENFPICKEGLSPFE